MNLGDDSNYTIAAAFATYLLTNSPKKTSASQKIDRRVLAIAQHFFQKHGLSLVSEVRVEHLEQFEIWAGEPQQCGDFSKDAWSQASILRHGKTIKTIFRKAFLTGRIARDPAALWKLSSADPSVRRRPMTDQEFDRLLEIAPDWYKPVLRILAATGARGSSIARLKWVDVDFDNAVMFLTSRKGGAKREKRNPFPIYPGLRDIMMQIPRLQNDFVFLKDGNPITKEMISMTGHKLIRRANFEGVVLYGLRHKFATDLLRAGTSTEIARRLLGHSNERMLKEYSQHLGIDALDRAVSSIRGKK